MERGTFWVGEKPGRVITISVYDELGKPFNLTPYTGVSLEILDTDNNVVDLTGSTTSVTDGIGGKIGFVFPSDRSIFTKPGEYLVRVKMTTATALDYTDAGGITVRKFGGTRF